MYVCVHAYRTSSNASCRLLGCQPVCTSHTSSADAWPGCMAAQPAIVAAPSRSTSCLGGHTLSAASCGVLAAAAAAVPLSLAAAAPNPSPLPAVPTYPLTAATAPAVTDTVCSCVLRTVTTGLCLTGVVGWCTVQRFSVEAIITSS